MTLQSEGFGNSLADHNATRREVFFALGRFGIADRTACRVTHKRETVEGFHDLVIFVTPDSDFHQRSIRLTKLCPFAKYRGGPCRGAHAARGDRGDQPEDSMACQTGPNPLQLSPIPRDRTSQTRSAPKELAAHSRWSRQTTPEPASNRLAGSRRPQVHTFLSAQNQSTRMPITGCVARRSRGTFRGRLAACVSSLAILCTPSPVAVKQEIGLWVDILLRSKGL